MKYKVGDKVRIKGLDWYNKYKDEDGDVPCGEFYFVEGMKKFCSETFTISDYDCDCVGYLMLEDHGYVWTDEMIERLVEEETKNNNDMEEKETLLGLVKESDNLRLVPHKDYEIKQDGEKFYLVKKKPKYPQTYEECCKVLELIKDEAVFLGYEVGHKTYKESLVVNFQKLLICRDAYWKIAGEEMGLDKPWEPDYKKVRYGICRYIDDIVKIYRSADLVEHHILQFPTEEMRDAFKENNEISKLIEECKEFL